MSWIGPFLITISYLAISTWLGITAKGKIDMSVQENWATGGNSLGLFALVFLIGAGNVSAYTFLGSPGWAWSKGVPALYVVIYLCTMAITGYLLNPRISLLNRRFSILTESEGFGIRFESKGLRVLSAVVAVIASIGSAMVQAIGVGYILSVMSEGRIPQGIGTLIVLTCVCCYVFASGLKAIGWTNVLQGILMFILSFLVGFYLLWQTTGGLDFQVMFDQVIAISPEHITLPGALGDMPISFWATSILISTVSYWPQYWLWSTSGKSPELIRRSATLTPLYYFVMVPMLFVGFMCVYAFPNAAELGIEMDKVSLTYCMEHLPWWMMGLLGAGVLAASQSTCESQYHSATLSISHDIIVPLKPNVNEGKVQRYMLWVVILGIAFPLALWNPSNLVYILLVAYGFMGQIFPLIIGMFVWPRMTKAGAFAGLLAGSIVVALCNTVWTNPMGIHAGIWALMVNIPINIIVSLCTKPASEKTLRIFFDEKFMDKIYEK